MEALLNNQLILANQIDNSSYLKQEHTGDNSNNDSFILANTEECTIDELKNKHIIPVYVKDNEPLISHFDFIEATYDAVSQLFGASNLSYPSIRVSHPIKGRIPGARHKKASELLEDEKTLYFERMMFLMDLPSKSLEVGGNHLNLTIGGVKAYNLDNLYNRKGGPEHFKVFIGFKNRVCTNLCVSTDGLLLDVRVTSCIELKHQIFKLIKEYNATDHVRQMKSLENSHLSEREFAHLMGKCKMYNYLPTNLKRKIPELMFGDAHINCVCKDYYKDESFCKDEYGNISLWRLFNLFTGANKSSYIDTYLPRAVNASDFVLHLNRSLHNGAASWFL